MKRVEKVDVKGLKTRDFFVAFIVILISLCFYPQEFLQKPVIEDFVILIKKHVSRYF